MNHTFARGRLLLPLLIAITAAGCDSASAPATPGGPGTDGAVVGTPDAGGGDTGDNPGGGFNGGPGTTPGGGGDNHPPSLYKIGDKEVPIGETLVIDLEANDPDGDTLVFSVFGQLPDGAKFSKPNKQLAWTPDAASVSAFLTFVVSDGELFDRETVELRSVTEKSNHAPVLEPLGDQAVAPGAKVELRLEASDIDGDAIAFGMDGEVPAGATLEPGAGVFTWTPTTADDGRSYRVRFTASDGQEESAIEVKLLVGEGAGSPPAFEPLATQKIGAGQTLQFEVEAKDPDGDALTYSTKGALPAGASFKPSIRLFAWQPSASQAGQAFTVTFQATDGTYTAVLPVDIVVGSPTGGASCDKDSLEPNDTAAAASKVGPGSHDLSLCDVGSTYDVDWFAVTLGAGEKLTATVSFDAGEGDIDVDLYDPKGGDEPLTQSSGVGDEEEVSFTSQAGGSYLLAVYGVGQEVFRSSYTLTVAIEKPGAGQPPGCVDDDGEDDDTIATAGTLPASGSVQAHICPNDLDAWKVDVSCGQSLDVLVTGYLPGDLDLYVFDPASPSSPVAQAVTEGPKESLTTAPASSDGQLVLVVAGYPPEKTDAPYTLSATKKGSACKADFAEPNDTKGDALPLIAGDTVDELRVCCDDDWFAIDLLAGDTLTATASVSGSATLELWPSGAAAVPLAKAPGGSGTLSLTQTVAAKGTFALRIGPGSAGSSYSLSVKVDKGATSGCTKTSCPIYQVCDKATGKCVSDYCTKDSECPADHLCIDTYCTAGCEADADCQKGYRCKGFPQGSRCGIEGSGATGDGCTWFSDCEGTAACLFQGDGGYCAQVGCASYLDCPADAECVPPPGGGTPICAQWCIGGGGCSAAFGCTSWKDVDGLTTEVCLP